ncbi:MAG: RtcB family protein [Acidobacteriota bacterium]
MKVVRSENIPIRMWLDDIEPGAFEQAKNLANLPFAFSHISIMPDAHQGFGMPIGGVLATKGVVIPNAVGVDIGCGISAVRTSLKNISSSEVRNVLNGIRQVIPVGFTHHKKEQDEKLMPDRGHFTFSKGLVVNREYRSALRQLGTLGGGNHFVEIQKGNDGFVWIMVHSGSRNIGYKVAEHYNKIAKEQTGKGRRRIPPKWDLAYLISGSDEEKKYFEEMQYCVDFAFASRKVMIDRTKKVFTNKMEIDVCYDNFINIAHNYAASELHFGTPVIVHRKGATSAKKDEAGIIPGSQGTPSYIIRGKGNPESFMSCSHGAGRKMGRRQAVRELNLDYEREKLEREGIIHSIHSRKDLDEASSAYKDIKEVMKNQEDLVEIVTELKPLGVIKG